MLWSLWLGVQAAAAGDTADDRVEMRFQRPIGHPSFKNFNREEAEVRGGTPWPA